MTCVLCGQTYTYDVIEQGTSSMVRHLSRKHPEVKGPPEGQEVTIKKVVAT